MEADEILLGQHGMFLNVRFLGAELAVFGTVLSVASEKNVTQTKNQVDLGNLHDTGH